LIPCDPFGAKHLGLFLESHGLLDPGGGAFAALAKDLKNGLTAALPHRQTEAACRRPPAKAP